MRKSLLFLILFSVILTGCIQQGLKDNQVYIAEKNSQKGAEDTILEKLNVEGSIPFQEYNLEQLQEDLGEKIPLAISPDGKNLFLMEAINNREHLPVIKGEPDVNVRVLMKDLETKEEKVIIEDVPFISQVRWNNAGNIIAFGGGKRLSIYDTVKKDLVLEDELKNDSVTFFFWSPHDENKLYSEHPNLTNGSIYYVNLRKKVEAYETKEDLYFKGKLDNDFFYGTKWFVASEKDKKDSDSINTVIVDKMGNIVKVLNEGRFRDAYKKSLVQVGESGFGLYYVADINKPNNIKTLSKEFIFDVKFVAGGKIAYIVEKEDPENNLFILYIVDEKGREIKSLEVSGSSIALSPDGKTGYVGGPGWEKVNFETNEIDSKIPIENEDSEQEEIFRTLRGAMDTYYKFEVTGSKDWDKAKKYFIDTESPPQWAYFDLTTRYMEVSQANVKNDRKNLYRIFMELQDFKIDSEEKRASVSLHLLVNNDTGGGLSMDHALELIKKGGKWYVTGFSTFPFSSQREEVKNLVEKYVMDAQEGKIFSGILEGKEVEIGQIQFWRYSLPHLAPNIETANFCKVYLKVKSNGQEKIYKMVLDRQNQNYWKPTKLTDKELSSL